jgi:hypothetical protein
MQTLGRRYVRYINHTYRRSGTLWEGRYHVSLVQGNRYLLTCYRYIELNPPFVPTSRIVRPITTGAATRATRSGSGTY